VENYEYFSIKDALILRRIGEQAREARLADDIDTEITRYKRLAYYHLEVVVGTLLELKEEQDDKNLY
jgi:hypothetical protein